MCGFSDLFLGKRGGGVGFEGLGVGSGLLGKEGSECEKTRYGMGEDEMWYVEEVS